MSLKRKFNLGWKFYWIFHNEAWPNQGLFILVGPRLKTRSALFFIKMVCRHHREHFVFNVEMYWHLYWPSDALNSIVHKPLPILLPISSLHTKLNQNKNARFCESFLITNCVLKDTSVKGFENVLQIFLRLVSIRLLTPHFSLQTFVSRHLTLCYTVALFMKFWSISGHQNSWNICQKQTKALLILQNYQSCYVFVNKSTVTVL